MKYISAVAFALLYSSEVSAVQLEHFYRLQQRDGMIYVPDHQIYLRQAYIPQSYVQSQYKPRRIIDADGDGVEDNVKLDQYALDRFRKAVFSAPVEDMHNTHNGEMPGHLRFGDSPEPGVNPWALAMAKEKANYEAKLAAKLKLQELEAQNFSGVQLDAQISFDETDANSDYDHEPSMELSQLTTKVNEPSILDKNEPVNKWKKPYSPRKINDADGDGVEDNVAKSQKELDRFRKPVFGEDVDDIHNTKHGNFPGHTRAGENPEPTSHPNGATKLATGEQNMEGAQAQEMTKEGVKDQLVKSQDENSYSDYDKEPSLVQITSSIEDNQHKLLNFQRFIQSPDDLDVQLSSSVRNWN